MNTSNYLPDVYHDYEKMLGKYQSVMSECCQPWGLVNRNNQLGGVLFISDVVPGHEGVLYIFLWDKSCYTATTHRFMLDYIEHCVMSNQLDRLVCRTPDDKGLGRLLERLHFKLEARMKSGFKGGGRSQVLFQFRRLFA
jgi:RimJ/RimL family protein N-acetyltransferase